MNPIFKALAGSALRHLLTIIFTLVVVNHYVGADIAAKLMHGDTLTLWGGYNLSMDSIVNYVLLSLVPAALPILWATWIRIKSKFKQIIALQSSHPADVAAAVAFTSPVGIIKTVSAAPAALA